MIHLNIGPIIRKEFRQIRRDRRALGILIFLPAFMLVMVGYALNFDVKHLAVAVYDEDKSSTSRDFVAGMVQSEYFDLRYAVKSKQEIDPLLENGDATVAFVIPNDFSRLLLSGKEARVQVLIDGSNSNTASIAQGYVALAVQDYSNKILVQWLEKRGKHLELPITIEPKLWYNPDLKSAKYLIPGLFGLILMIVTVISTSLSIVREKEQGTMEQLKTSPLWSNEIILGKTIPYLLISIIAATIIMIFGWLLFDVSIKGSIPLLYGAIILFLIGGLGQGMLISNIAQTQQVAFIMSVFSSLLPSFLLSGFVFPISSMPWVLQAISNVIPAKFFLVVVRSIILKGVGLPAFWEQFIYLFLFALITIGISTIRLQRELSR
ncbi:MAG: ABC transporter permease [Ignavibacteriales bacterium]|nr:ABC transporter permease [Ignavibacteriales bacterium]